MQYIDFVKNTNHLNITNLIGRIDANKVINEICDVKFYEERNQKAVDIGVDANINGQNNWSSFTLFSKSGKSSDTISQGITLNENKGSYKQSLRNLRTHKWTEVANQFPYTVQWIQDNLCPYVKLSYVKIAKLGPGGHVPEHNDKPNVSTVNMETHSYDMLNTILIELTGQDDLYVTHDGKQLKYKAGDIYWINVAKNHEVKNNSDSDRYNIRIHGLYNTRFREMIKKCYMIE